ncbi:MAG: hypothetical protein FWB98_04160 [Defluviitaleaceae bacterium]|nr:hypothetical protein [Defluviitaleaceae bacterium]
MQKLLRSEVVAAVGFFVGTAVLLTLWGFDDLWLPGITLGAGLIYTGLFLFRSMKISKLKKVGKTYEAMVMEIRADIGSFVRAGYRMDCGYTNQNGDWKVVTSRNHMLGGARKTSDLTAVVYVDETHPKQPFEVEVFRKFG